MLLRSLNDIFYFASINSSLIKTKSELEFALDTWKLDFSSHSSLNASLTQLRTVLADLTGKDYADIDLTSLYISMHRRILRERLPAYMVRDLNDIFPHLEASKNGLELHNSLLAILTPGIGKIRSERKDYAIAQVNSTVLAIEGPATPRGNASRNDKSGSGSGGSNKKSAAKQQKSLKQDRGRSRSRDKSKDSRNRSRSKSRFTTVKQWPQGKPYLTKDKKSFLPEFEAWFRNYCFRCGMSNHRAADCRIYPSANIVMSLCAVCSSGLHDKCKNYRFINKDSNGQNYNQSMQQKDGMVTKQISVRGPDGMYYPNPPPLEVDVLDIRALQMEEED
jgi:hypothetical protein